MAALPPPGPDAHDRSVDPAVEEVRLAMALNGGVSLAVWMGGCAVELDCARRAHLGEENVTVTGVADASAANRSPLLAYLDGEPPRHTNGGSDAKLRPRSVYHALCAAFERRLVIDIMSGASAGGINGALLGAAMTKGRRLHPDFVRDRWLDLGDFATLLHPTSELRPQSLMRGAYFHDALTHAFERLLADGRDPWLDDPRRVPPAAPVLDVTTTDIQGAPLRFVDAWGRPLLAAEHRARLRFRTGDDYTAEALAGAARASASFPLAFEPWLIRGEARTRAGFDGDRWVLDGGLLDNAPIAAALEQIPGRTADCQVQRYACYVNADPPQTLDTIRDQPPITGVVGATLGLPRTAPFVDQLHAIERATRRADVTGEVELRLLTMRLAPLRRTAKALLPAYRRQRQMLAIAELAPDPETAQRALDRVGRDRDLPWLPTTVATPAPGAWGWGFRTAERLHHLALDLIRRAVRVAGDAERTRLLAARVALYDALADLAAEREAFQRCAAERVSAIAQGADADAELGRLARSIERRDPAIRAQVDALVAELAAIAPVLGNADGVAAGTALFGPDWDADAPVTAEMAGRFLRRGLAIEVVRRAFDADDPIVSPQRLRFVQLTPFAPTPILRSDMPGDDPARDRPDMKLTGVLLGHFGGFYRRAWRANDFMWGRLDAAARIVDLLVDHERAAAFAHRADGPPPWTLLADALLPIGARPAQRWIVREALRSAKVHAGAGHLRDRLERALEADLTAEPEPGRPACPFTRWVCARAAQLEVLEHELPILVRESETDAALGAGRRALAIPTGDGPQAMVEALRDLPEPLPARLGADPRSGEIASALALRTIAHAASVAFATVRESGIPLARSTSYVRVVLLPVAGAVARAGMVRIALLVGFWAAALYVAARAVRAGPGSVTLRDTLAAGPALEALALLVVAGVAGVPLLRCLRGRGAWFRAGQAAWCAALLAAGAVIAVVLAVWAGVRALDQVLVAPGGPDPPWWIVAAVLVTVVGVGGGRLGPLRPLAEGLVGVPGASRRSVALIAATAAAVLGWSAWQALGDTQGRVWWQWLAVAVAAVVAPVLGALHLLPAPGRAPGATDPTVPRAPGRPTR